MEIAVFVKERRKALKMTQPELASKAGVGLRFVRELEQGKNTLRMDKVNQVLKLFGHVVGAVPAMRNYSFQSETQTLEAAELQSEYKTKKNPK